MLTSNLRLALAALLSLLLCVEPAFASVMAMSAPRTPSAGATAYAYPPETGQTLMVFTPFHDVVFDQTVCFNNANDVQNFVGGPGSSQPGAPTSALAQTYFSPGGGGGVNKICFTRISQGWRSNPHDQRGQRMGNSGDFGHGYGVRECHRLL
jgi:hypothetical protein